MKTLHFSITINAPKEKVWDTMLNESTYRQWTAVFAPDGSAGSFFEGSWEEGADIRFLSRNEKGELEGMKSRIKKNDPHSFISVEHVGMIQNGQVDTTSDKVKAWVGAHENYTFKEAEGVTTVSVDTDTVEEFVEMFAKAWPKALQKLKELAEAKQAEVG